MAHTKRAVAADAAITEPARPHVDQLIPRRKGLVLLGISPTTAWRRERDDPEFPPKVRVGHLRYAFRLSDLEKYIATRPHVATPAPQAALDAARAAREQRK